MGKKKSQKNKGEASQEQKQQPTQQQQQTQPQQPSPPQPTPGPSGDPETSQAAPSKGGKSKKRSQAQQQQPQPSQQPRPPLEQKQEQRPLELPVQQAWQQKGPQQQQRVSQKERRESQQSTPSPQQQQQQSGARGPQQQGRGKGKGRDQQQSQAWQKGPQQQPPQRQQPSAPHSPSPSPQQPGFPQEPRRGSQQSTPSPQPQQQPGAGRGTGRGQPQPGQSAWQRGPSQSQQQGPSHPQQQHPQRQPQQQVRGPSPQQQPQVRGPPQQQQPQVRGPPQQQQQPQVRGPPQQQPQVRGPPQQQQPQVRGPPQQQQPQVRGPPQQQPQVRGPPQQQQPQVRGPPQQQQTQVPSRVPPSFQQQPQSPQQTGQPAAGGASRTPAPKAQPPPQQTPSGQAQPGTSQESSALANLPIPRRKQLKSAGTAGRKILIETNHLLMDLRKLRGRAVHYDVAIDPDKPKRLLKEVMEAFRQINYPQRFPGFDGVKNLYSSPELPFGDQIEGEVTIQEDERSKTYKVTVKFAAAVDLTALSRYFESAGEEGRHMVTPQDAIQCLDVALRTAPSLRMISVGRSFFTRPPQLINLGEGMEMYYGFYQSAILGWKPFLNVDVAHKAFPKSLRLIDLIPELCNRCNLNDKLHPQDFSVVDKFLRTLKVQYEIPKHPTSRRVMRINQLDKTAREARFKTDNGQEMTVEQYFMNEKGYPLRYPNMPCAWVGSRARESKILFPIELCTLVDGQVTNRQMTPNQTSAMIKEAATSASVRKNRIMESIRAANFNQSPSALEFGISVSENFAKVPARVLDPPFLTYANNKSVRPQRGVWRADAFKSGMALQNWCILGVDGRTHLQELQEFGDMMIQQGRPLGMQIAKPNVLPPIRLSFSRARQELEAQFSKLKGVELILVVIPNDIKDIYFYVKQAAELSVGTLTQCVRGRNVFRPKPATVGNILLKVNAKLNGVNHALQARPRCLDRPCMIMGADVTHPSPETKGTVPSVAAVTASHDPQAFQYNISWRLQPPAQEIITDLANIVRQHLVFFFKKNNRLKPERIIFFRDGVSEGQFQMVLNAEVHAIRQACAMVQKDGMYKPKITFLVVQKRHHTRFFPTHKNDSEDRNGNVPAGTIVDTEITHPTALDFYLVSHASIQGVARPTKYRMLWDDNDMTEDELEQLTYHLCHLFTRCTRSVSYPAPTYYAHLAAARAKVYCEKRSINLDNLQWEQDQLIIKPEIVEGLPMYFV